MGAVHALYVGRKTSAAIAAHRIVFPHATIDFVVTQASSPTAQKLCGVSGPNGSTAADDSIDVAVQGIAVIEYGGVVAAGDWLTSDASGRAVVAAVGQKVIGQAQEKGVLGTLGSCLVNPSELALS